MTIGIELRPGAPHGVELVELKENRFVSRHHETVVCSDGEWHAFAVRQGDKILEGSAHAIKGMPAGEGGFVQGDNFPVPAGQEHDLEEAHLIIRSW